MPNNKTTDTDPISASVSTTSCRKCVFADYEGKTQVGCTAGRMEVFKKNGVDFICVGDEEETYYLIKDKACPYFRHVDGCEELLKSKTIDELKEMVKSSLKMPYHVLIFLRKEDSLEDLEQRLSELEQQAVKPKIVSVIDRTHSGIDLTPKIVGLFHNKYTFDTWRTQRVAAIDRSDYEVIDVCYDNTKNLKYFFYIMFEASRPIPDSFSEEIHYAVQEEMKSFVILEPNSYGNGKAVLKMAHAKYAGNSFDIDLKDKIIHYDDAAHLIRKVEDLCPSLRTC
jgi:hypothetical protein